METLELGGGQPIELQVTHATLGGCYNSFALTPRELNIAFTDSSLKESEVQEEASADAKRGYIQLSVCETAEELASHLEIKAQVAASFWGVGTAGSASSVASTDFKATSLVAMIRGWSETVTQSLRIHPELTDDALEALRDPEDFLLTYGDYFCGQLIFGAELVALLRVDTRSLSEKQEVASKLSVGWVTGKSETEVKAAWSEATSDRQTEFYLYENGGRLDAPQDITGLLKYTSQLFEEAKQNPVLYRAKYSPYTKLAIKDKKLRKNLVNYLKAPWRNRDKLLRRYGDYRHILDNFDAGVYFYLPGDYAEPIKDEINSHLDAIKDEWRDKKESPHELRPPEAFLSGPLPEQYEKKFKDVHTSELWGGSGGDFVADDKDNLGVIIAMHFMWDPTYQDGVFIRILWWKEMEDGQKLRSDIGWSEPPGSLPYAEFHLTKGEYINRVRVRADQVVRQVTFWTNRGEQYGPYPPGDPARWAGAEEFELENVVVHGFQGRGSEFRVVDGCGVVDAFGVIYTPVAEPEAGK